MGLPCEDANCTSGATAFQIQGSGKQYIKHALHLIRTQLINYTPQLAFLPYHPYLASHTSHTQVSIRRARACLSTV